MIIININYTIGLRLLQYAQKFTYYSFWHFSKSLPITVWHKILTGENIDEFDKFLSIRQHFPHQNFPLIIFCRLHARQLFCPGHYH